MVTRAKSLAKYYIEKYPLTFKEDISQKDPKCYEVAWAIAKKATLVLKDNYGAEKVMVFGSLTNKSSFTRWSDIDLAVSGIPDEKFYAAVGAVTSLTTKFKIDLVDISACRASLRNAIETEGIEV